MSSLNQRLPRPLRRIWLGVTLARKGPLRDRGWFESVMTGRSIDRDGQPTSIFYRSENWLGL